MSTVRVQDAGAVLPPDHAAPGGKRRPGMLTLLGGLADLVASVSLFGLMAMSFLDVFGRNLFNKPLPGTIELTELLMATIVFAVLPGITRRNEHVVIDLLDPLMPPAVRVAQRVVANVLGAITFFVIAWQLWEDGAKTARYGGTTPYFEMPLAPFIYVMAAMAALAAVGFVTGVFKRTESEQ
jgi:TRAP-type C4-dicarboxylate transport system permease small subunit